MTDCPPDDTLRDYLDDSLSPDRAGPVTGHIDACPRCQERLDGLTSESGRLASRVKQAAATDGAVRPSASSPDQATYLFGDGVIPIVPRLGPTVLPTIPGYVVREEIGRGGMGVVYKALHKRLNRTAAVKMVLAGGLADPRVTQRFLFEAEILGRVRHPQVVQVYEVSMYAAPTGVSIPFLAMEYLDGGTLGAWSDGRPQPPKAAAELVEGLARAVQAAHAQGVIHRDLKPANILRAADGVFKVTDFGLAKLTADTSGGLTATGTVVGTPAYMAPEQASGEKGIGPPADVYSLGAILFELLTGRPPFEGAEPMSVLLKVIRDQPPEVRALRPEVPRDLSAAVAKCLTKEPHRRYASAAELADDLGRFRAGRPTRARAHGTAERVWYWSKRNPGIAAMLASLLLVMATAFVSVMVLWRRAEGNATAMTEARDLARREFDEAAVQRDEAAKQRRAADSRGAYLAFDQAVHWCENGQLDDGLRGFVRALELAERIGDRDLARVARVNVDAWDRELFPAGKQFHHSDTAALTASGFSPDGQWVFTAGTDRRVAIWDADSGKRVADLTDAATGHVTALIAGLPFAKGLVDPPSIRAVAISHDRTRVAACLSSGGIAVWSPTTAGKPLRTVPAVVGKQSATDLWAAAFDSEGKLWVGGNDGVLARFDVDTGKECGSLPLPPDDAPPPAGPRPTTVHALKLSADGQSLFSGDREGRVIEWSLRTKQAVGSRAVGGWVYDVALSPDGRTFAAGGTAWAGVFPAGGTPWILPANGAEPTTVQFAAGGRLVVLGDSDGKAQAWDTATRAPVGRHLRMGRFVPRLVARPGRDELLVPNGDGVRLQPLPAPPTVFIPPSWAVARVRVLDYSPDGDRLLVGAGRLNVHDAATGRAVRAVCPDDEALGGQFLAGGTRVAYGLRSGLRVFDLGDQGEVLRLTSRHYISLFAAGTVADVPVVNIGGRFDRLSADGAKWLDTVAPTGIDLARFPTGAACVAPGGREVRFASFDTVYFHDLDTGAATRPPLRAPDEVRAMAQTPDGKRLVLGLRDNTVQVWDVATGTARHAVPPRHEMPVTGLVVSPDGRTILSGSRDQSARFWDADTGLVLGPKLRHADAVAVVAYSPRGDRVATGTSTGRTVTWPVPPPPTTADLATLRDRYANLSGNSRPATATYK